MAKAVSWVLLFLAIEVQLCPEVELCPAWRYGFGAFDSKECCGNDISPRRYQLEETGLKKQQQKLAAGLRTTKSLIHDPAWVCFPETLQFFSLLAVVTFAWNSFCYFRMRYYLHRRDLWDEDTFDEPLGQIQPDSPPPHHPSDSPPPYSEGPPPPYSEGPPPSYFEGPPPPYFEGPPPPYFEGSPPPYIEGPPPSYEESQSTSNVGASVFSGNPLPQHPHLSYIQYHLQHPENGENGPVVWFIFQRNAAVAVATSHLDSGSDSDSDSYLEWDSHSDSEY